MRKRLLAIFLPMALVLTIGTVIISIYAWYIDVMRVGTIDAETKDVAFTYKIDDGIKDSNTYSITNLSFFDIDDLPESKYLTSMVCMVTIEVTNTMDADLDFEISFIPVIKEVKDGETIKSQSYVEGIMSSSNTLSIDDTKTIAANLEATDALPVAKTDDAEDGDGIPDYRQYFHKVNAGDTHKFYLFLFGVQLIDSAQNSDFLYTESNGTRTMINHEFDILLVAYNNTSYDVEEVETSSTGE